MRVGRERGEERNKKYDSVAWLVLGWSGLQVSSWIVKLGAVGVVSRWAVMRK